MKQMLNTCALCGCPTRNELRFINIRGRIYDARLCDACVRKAEGEVRFANEQRSENDIVCPNCGHIAPYFERLHYGVEDESYECPECGYVCNMFAYVVRHFITSRRYEDMPAGYEYGGVDGKR